MANGWPGKIAYITGGTTGSPRLVTYDAPRWRRSVAIKARLLDAYGVDHASRIAVCYPFAPWAIGSVFAEAALACGATVLPLGLDVRHRALQQVLHAFDPTHVCATGRALIQWAREMMRHGHPVSAGTRRTAFVAGEGLTPSTRARAQQLWSAIVVNVYGMAEFDMVGAQLPGINGICLVPEFAYGLRRVGSTAPEALSEGAAGVLAIRDDGMDRWHYTADRVRVGGRVRPAVPGWAETWRIELLGRSDEAATLADGSTLTSDHLLAVRDACPEVERIQAVVRHTLDGDRIALRCVARTRGDTRLLTRIADALLTANVDLADGRSRGIIQALDVHLTSETKLRASRRGKIPMIVEVDENDHR